MFKRSAAIALAALLASGLLWSIVPAAETAKEEPAAEKAPPPPAKPAVAELGKPAPTFALTDHEGKQLALSDFADKIVVLEWINPECPVSKGFYTNGAMKALAEKLAAKGVVWLAVNTTHNYPPDKNKTWVEQYKLPYPILDDRAGDVGRLYEAKTTPDMRVIDKSGKLVYSGAIDNGNKKPAVNYVEAAVEDLLAGKEVATPRTKPYGCSVKYGKKPAAAPKGDAPPFVLTDHNGKSVSLSDFAGKIVVLEWINPDCPVSRRFYTNGEMKALAEKYAAKGVVWLAINSTDYYPPDKNKAWAEKYSLPYPILDDRPGKVGHLYEAKTTPDMRIIDQAGNVVYRGAINDDPSGRKETPVNYVAAALDELLAGKKVTTARTQAFGCSVKYAK